jgi:hypothetical protein
MKVVKLSALSTGRLTWLMPTGAYRVSVGKPEGRRPLGRPRRRWENNIKVDIREIRSGKFLE